MTSRPGLRIAAAALPLLFWSSLVHAQLGSLGQGAGGDTSLDGPTPVAGSSEAIGSVDPSTGVAQASYAFNLPTARGAAQPSLGLTYSSASGVGFAGQGWTLDVPSIVRKGASGIPKFIDDPMGSLSTDSDRYEYDGMSLVPMCSVLPDTAGNGRCGTPGEGFPAQVRGWIYFRTELDNGMRFFLSPTGDTWIVQDKSGCTSIFGNPMDGASAPEVETQNVYTGAPDPNAGTPNSIYRWALARRVDPSGNTVYYGYAKLNPAPDRSSGILYLTDIFDTPQPGGGLTDAAHHTHLRWSPLPCDTTQSCNHAQSPIWHQPSDIQLTDVDVSVATPIGKGPRIGARRYHLSYVHDAGIPAHLSWITLEGACDDQVEDSTTYLLPDQTSCPRMPPTVFHYNQLGSALQKGTHIGRLLGGQVLAGAVATADLNGDSFADIYWSSGSSAMSVAYGPSFTTVDSLTMESGARTGPGSLTPRVAQLSDIAVGSPTAMLGDWIGDGAINLAWLHLGQQIPVVIPNLDEIYSLAPATSKSQIGPKWVGNGPFTLPLDYGLNSGAPDWTAGRAFDVDGDGLTDAALVQSLDPSCGGPFSADGPNTRVFFSERGSDGTVHPFARAGAMTAAPPGMILGDQTSLADMDGDGFGDLVWFSNDGGNNGPSPLLRVHWMKNRGDGRFGSYDAATVSTNPCQNGAHDAFDEAVVNSAGNNGGYGDIEVERLVTMHDVTGDGYADFIGMSKAGLQVCVRYQDASSGTYGFGGCQTMSLSDLGWGTSSTSGYNGNSTQILIDDFDANGVDDVMVMWNDGATVVNVASSTAAETLSSVTTSNGLTTTYVYDTLANVDGAQGAKMPRTGLVVTKIGSTNGLPAPQGKSYETDYQYAKPVYDARDRQFLGFQSVTITTPGDSTMPGQIVTTTYDTATCPGVQPGTPCPAMADYGYRMQRRLPVATETFDASTKAHLSTTITGYSYTTLIGADERNVRIVHPASVDAFSWSPAQQGVTPTPSRVLVPSTVADIFAQVVTLPIPQTATRTHRSVQYDLFGNPVSSVDFGVVGKDQPILTTTSWLMIGPTQWGARATMQRTSYADSSGVNVSGPLRESDLGYDALGRLTSVASPLSGTMALVRHPGLGGGLAPAPANASADSTTPIALVNITYDAYGNPTQIQRPGNRCETIQYDGYFQQLPSAVMSNPSGGCAASGSQIGGWLTYDRRFGAVTNTLTTKQTMSMTSYDAFGRVTEVFSPDDTVAFQLAANPSLQVAYPIVYPNGATLRMVQVRSDGGTKTSAVYSERWSYVDAFDDVLVTLNRTDADGQWVVSGAHTNAASGVVAQSFDPFFAALSSGSSFGLGVPYAGPSSSTVRDAIGRVLAATNEDGVTSTFSYDNLAQTADLRDGAQQPGQPHAGSYTRATFDGHGRAVSVDRHSAVDPASDDVIATATYLATGEPTSLVRSHAGQPSVTRTTQYDSWGRVVSNLEPNSSAATGQPWIYAYDTAGNLVGTSDPRGCGENLFYDPLGRVVAEDYSPCIGSQAPYSAPNLKTGDGTEAFYVYDNRSSVATNGELVEELDRAQHVKFAYDRRGRVTSVQRQLATPQAALTEEPQPLVAQRYAPHWFVSNALAYDAAGRLTTQTTGADVPQLLDSTGASAINTAYSLRGYVSSVTSSYGGLLRSVSADASARPLQVVLADAASTTSSAAYSAAGLLENLMIRRAVGPWVNGSSSYSPPKPTEPNTLQWVLTDLWLGYDAVGNPTSIKDTSQDLWPAGALPPSRTMTYDDHYRLKTVSVSYPGANGDDVFTPPYPASKTTHAPVVSTPNRVRSQSFQYDWLDDIIDSTDDANVFPDRSLGTITPGGQVATARGPNQVAAAKSGSSSLTPSYDAGGYLTQLDVTYAAPCPDSCMMEYTYAWDEVGHLELAMRSKWAVVRPPLHGWVPEVTEYYAYDASGGRVLRSSTDASLSASYDADVFSTLRLAHTTFPDASGDYVRSATTEEVDLVDASGVRFGRTVYDAAGTMPTVNGPLHVFMELGDHQGSSSFVIDHDTGELVERASYLAFGGAESDYHPDRWADQYDLVRYTGHEDDSDVGLTYFGARYYVPTLGRWASPDPLAVHAGGADANVYAFVHNSPIGRVDPMGYDDGDDGGAPGRDCGVDGAACSGYGWTSPWGDWGGGGGANGSTSSRSSGGGPRGGGGYGGGAARPPPPPIPSFAFGGGVSGGRSVTVNLSSLGIAPGVAMGRGMSTLRFDAGELGRIALSAGKGFAKRYVRTVLMGTYDFVENVVTVLDPDASDASRVFAGVAAVLSVIPAGKIEAEVATVVKEGAALAEEGGGLLNSVVEEATPLLDAAEGLETAAGGVASDAKLFQAYRTELAAQEIQGADAVGSALKSDAYHRSASFVTDTIAADGKVFSLANRTGTVNLTQVLGEMNGAAGRFEWIVDGSGNLTHQMFVGSGGITGVPIAP